MMLAQRDRGGCVKPQTDRIGLPASFAAERDEPIRRKPPSSVNIPTRQTPESRLAPCGADLR
jgi:hypothetical protein